MKFFGLAIILLLAGPTGSKAATGSPGEPAPTWLKLVPSELDFDAFKSEDNPDLIYPGVGIGAEHFHAFRQNILSATRPSRILGIDRANGIVRTESDGSVFGFHDVHAADKNDVLKLKVGDMIIPVGKGLGRNEFVGDNLHVISDCSERPFQLQDLAKIEARNQIDFLTQIPKDSLTKFTFAAHSQSLQADGASPALPRVVRFSTDGRTVMAYICDKRSATYNEIEVMQFDEATQRYQMAQIDFKTANGRPVTHVNPTSCLKCHGQDPRPIWHGYQTWPGFYGENDDQVSDDFLKFKKEQSDNPCYSTLPWANEAKEGPFKESFPYLPDGVDKADDYKLRPNAHFTIIQSRLNARRIAQKLLSSPDFDKIKYAALGLDLNCPSSRTFFSDVNHRVNKNPPLEIGDLAELSDFVHVSTEEWDLDRGSRDQFRTAQWPMTDFVASVLMERMAAQDPDLAPYNRRFNRMQELFGRGFQCVDATADRLMISNQQHDQLCELLDGKQKEITRKLGDYTPPQRSTPSTAVVEKKFLKPGEKLIDQHCSTCHDGFSAKLDLSGPSAIRDALHGQLGMKIKLMEYVQTCKMPKEGRCLSPTEQKSLFTYVRGI